MEGESDQLDDRAQSDPATGLSCPMNTRQWQELRIVENGE